MFLDQPNPFRPETSAPAPVIQVTALYENLEAGLRAKSLVDCVRAGMEAPAEFKLELWRFDWLGELSLGNMALSAARDSTLVIISTASDGAMPPELERWLRAWRQTPNAGLAALVLLAPHETAAGAAHPWQEQLQRTAQRKQAAFLPEFFETTSSRDDFTNRPRLHRDEFMALGQAHLADWPSHPAKSEAIPVHLLRTQTSRPPVNRLP